MKESRTERISLLILAFTLSAAIVFIAQATADLVIGDKLFAFEYRSTTDVVITFTMQILFSGLPFFVLAARSDRRPVMWLTAVVLTCIAWTYYVWQVWRDSLTGFAGGANMGLGLIMVASPFLILAVLKGVSFVLKAQPK